MSMATIHNSGHFSYFRAQKLEMIGQFDAETDTALLNDVL